MTVTSKFEGPAGPPSVNFEGPQSTLRAIGPRARLTLTPDFIPSKLLFGASLTTSKLQLILLVYTIKM